MSFWRNMNESSSASRLRLEHGLVWCYALFLAGFFFVPQAPDHYKVYYLLVFLPSLLLWRRFLPLTGRNAVFILMFVSGAYTVASVAWSDAPSVSLLVKVAWHALLVISFFAVGVLLASEHAGYYGLMLRRLVWFAACASVLSIVAFYAQHEFPATRLQPPLSRMDNAVLASCVYGLFCLLAAHYFASASQKDKLPYLLSVLALLTAILLTQSRTVLPALSLGFVILLGVRGIVAVGVVAVGITAVFLIEPQLWQQQLSRGLSFRPDIWQAVLQQASEHWCFGRGYSEDTSVPLNTEGIVHAHAHSAYLATLRDGGIVGLALLLGLLAVASLWAVKLAKCGERLYLALLAYAMVCMLADMDRLLTRPKEHWLYFWLPLVLVTAAHMNKRSVEQLKSDS